VARCYGPAAVLLGGRVLAPRRPVLAPEPGSCRRARRRQGLNAVGVRWKEPAAVGYGARCTFLKNFDSAIYFSKIMTK
jgi:hypothetical protein